MRLLKKIGKYFLFVLIVLNLLVVLSGNSHLYKGLSDTYLKGSSKPTIDDPFIFHTRTLKATNPQPWKDSGAKNQKPLLDKTKETHKKLGTKAFLVIHNQQVLFEEYYDGYDQQSISNSFSMAKTILSVITGVAVKEGKLSVNDPVVRYIPEFIEDPDSSLLIKHLLTMTSGVNFQEDYGNPFGFMAKAYYGTHLKELVKGYKIVKEPGVLHQYLGGNNLLLSFALEKAIGQKVADYCSEKLWGPLGMTTDAVWILDDEDGDEKTFTGVYATARDFSKFGLLYMLKGNYKGNQIVDSNYVQSSLTPINVKDEEGRVSNYYGYAWWLTSYKGHKVFYMRGILGQYVICIPSKNLIITRLGSMRSNTKLKDGIVPDDVWVYLEEGFNQIK